MLYTTVRLKPNPHFLQSIIDSITISFESGATSHDLMATYGWKSITQAETYTKGADRIQLGIKTSRRMADSLTNPKPNKLGKGK
ncbi:phage-related integrase/recombinase [Candidatus Liberibacter solanacearum CLso-ZC1]|uniref:Phage-related integrase/recombinase n=2 Tax=Candidatus Liberibacter solanacearum TaxID=556287 RepID=E4UBT0_LIBSC|nr:phage-related integrase/recombinase [Candidatus Liberibacter solanacearum CLso-ZC1]